MTASAQRPRKDQLRNRQRLLDAARTAFAEHGPGISLEAIARRAGVGTTTLYRHFPTKYDLVEQLLRDLNDGARRIAEHAMTMHDDWEAFRTVFAQGCVLEPTDLLLFDTLCRTSPAAAAYGSQVTFGIVAPVTERARHAGVLRTDVTVADIAALMRMADSAVIAEERRAAQNVLLDGLRRTAA